MSDPHPARHPEREDKRSFLQKIVEFIHPGLDSKDELIETLAEAEDNEVIGTEARVMLEGVIRMADRTATDIMVAAPRMDALRDLEKLVLLHANLYTLLMNFVSFADFYEPGNKAIFLAGTLYIDSRSCSLCVHVDDVNAHVRLATQSHLCLLYCLCVRKDASGKEHTATIAAALTAGSADDLIEGRHGVFVDNAGQAWDSTLLRVVRNPISLREAMWAPYIRFANLVGGQLQKLVAAKDAAISSASSKLASSTATGQADSAAKAAPPKQPFDIAKSAGIFAAVSVGISMVSASFTYIARSLFSLGWWWPMALLVIFAVISGPSVVMAWFKLRRRSLGPLLDASGWAVNTGAPINFTMGGALTAVGQMPPGAQRSLDDPYGLPARLGHSRVRRAFMTVLALLLLAAASLGGYWAWHGEAPSWLRFWQHEAPAASATDGKNAGSSGHIAPGKPVPGQTVPGQTVPGQPASGKSGQPGKTDATPQRNEGGKAATSGIESSGPDSTGTAASEAQPEAKGK